MALKGKELIEPRLLAILQNNGVSEKVMDVLGDNGVVALNVFACCGIDKQRFIDFIAKPPIGVSGTDVPGIIERAKLISAWESANTLKDVEVRNTAERLVQKLPPQLQVGDVETATKVFERAEHQLTKYTTPSKALFELLQGQIESYFDAIPLTLITSLDNQDANQSSTYGIDISSGLLRATASKPYAIPMPQKPEQLRARLELMGVAWCFSRSKNPAKAQLRTITTKIFDSYIKFLFGPRVWGLCTKDEHDNLVATPHKAR